MASSLENAISKQSELLNDLKATLEQELHLISSREPETLMQLLTKKESLLSQIESQDQAVEILYKRTVDTGNSVDNACNELLELCKSTLEECKYLTQINAKSVEQGQLKLVHLRNTMLELRARESMTYDKAGRTTGDASSKGISV
ncbi:flagellar export chaperone FlgN [Agaribacter flavus]|uniref:Flagellar export chaperone FlgN n=1 Tax=Agaribacter flavus TaxID=1902781 RepID=A0ABV7FR28_9ALTE